MLKDIWAEILHVLRIAQAAAPIVALVDPAAATGIGSAESALALVTPTINAIIANSAEPLTADQLTAHANTLVNFGVSTALAKGTITPEKAAAVTAAMPALVSAAVAIAAAASAPLSQPV